MPPFLTPDFGLIFWLLLAFAVLFFVLVKYGFPAMLTMVDERKKYIDESLANAREANEKLAQIQNKSEVLLKEAREQQAQILKEAMATRDSIVSEAKVQAQEVGAKVLEEAKKQIEAEKENALHDIRTQVTALSVQIAEKIMRDQLKQDAMQQTLIEQLLDEVETHQ